MAEDWRGVVNGVAYTLIYARDLDDAVVERVTRYLLKQPLFRLEPEEQYQTLVRAVESGADLASPIAEQHSGEDLRVFLRRVLARMDALRPWSPPPYLRLDGHRFTEEFSGARTIARMAVDRTHIGARIGWWDTVQHDGGEWDVLLLRLASGDEVALVAAAGAAGPVEIRHTGPGRPVRSVLKAFCAATGFTRREVRPTGPAALLWYSG
ncbi:hypothetical protein ACFY0F_10545 [Streptomyces sp. NPDC001544]|uniref:hypothetical protein n=1 Tax=Streptomyces sp. NPDC001544 TaxID=3364584 RepID=UPI00368B7EAE